MQDEYIEGLDPSAEDYAFEDTNPGAVQTRFFVQAERMPFLSEQAGRDVYKNWVYVERKWDLGRSHYIRRVNDEVYFDEADKKWKIKKIYPIVLAGDPPQPQSDIKRNPREWNAFVRGTSQDDVGTSLALLFKNDPARVEEYKRFHIGSVEALAKATDGMIEALPMGSRADRERARALLARIEAQAPSIAINNKLEEKDRQIEALQKQLGELTQKLTAVLTVQTEALASDAPQKRGRGRPRKEVESNETSVETLG